MRPRISSLLTRFVGLVALCGTDAFVVSQAAVAQPTRDVELRAGAGLTIVGVRPLGAKPESRVSVAAGEGLPNPRPRISGFSPRIAVAASNKKRGPFDKFPYEHELESAYIGDPLVEGSSADRTYVIGYLDSGADGDVVAGDNALALGLTGPHLTEHTIAIGGVGGQVDAFVTQPLGFFAAGLGAIDDSGRLDLTQMKGHSNVAGIVPPPIDCGNGESVTAIMGAGFMTFYNCVIRVDTLRTVTVNGQTITGPDVQILEKHELLPEFERAFSIEFGGFAMLPAATVAFLFDFEDQVTPTSPSVFALIPGSLPTSGGYFRAVGLLEGEPGPINPIQNFRMLVDTGAQASIISPAVVADLSLPLEPDFTVEVCGVGGLVPDVPGYYIDFVQISASGGPLRYSSAPFIVLDLPSPEGGGLDGILGMNFFWDRNVIFEPVLNLSGFFHFSEPVGFAFADNNLDFDIDHDDSLAMISCGTGPADVFSPDCIHFDADEDNDVDLHDFARLQICFSGLDLAAQPFCGIE